MIENTLAESSEMEKIILESCMLHKIIPESPTTAQKTTGATTAEGRRSGTIPENPTREKIESHDGAVHDRQSKSESPTTEKIMQKLPTMEKTMSLGPVICEMT